jgi:hypothetical protein
MRLFFNRARKRRRKIPHKYPAPDLPRPPTNATGVTVFVCFGGFLDALLVFGLWLLVLLVGQAGVIHQTPTTMPPENQKPHQQHRHSTFISPWSALVSLRNWRAGASPSHISNLARLLLAACCLLLAACYLLL